jgi:hypothetical protein
MWYSREDSNSYNVIDILMKATPYANNWYIAKYAQKKQQLVMNEPALQSLYWSTPSDLS